MQSRHAIEDHFEEIIDMVEIGSGAKRKLKRDNIQSKTEANQTHFEVGQKVRETIKELGGTMPENLPTPEKSIRQLAQKEAKKKKIDK